MLLLNDTFFQQYYLCFQPIGTIVGNFDFTATDVDAGDVITYQISGLFTSNDNLYFDVQGSKLVILNEIDLGTSTQQDYTVNVEAVDYGGLKCDITVTVHVMDVNQPHAITNLPRTVQLNALVDVQGDTVRRHDSTAQCLRRSAERYGT
jgi:hypothetical protein